MNYLFLAHDGMPVNKGDTVKLKDETLTTIKELTDNLVEHSGGFCPVDNVMELVHHKEHQWGPVEYSRMTGNPHRKCQVPGCKEVTLDLDGDEWRTPDRPL